MKPVFRHYQYFHRLEDLKDYVGRYKNRVKIKNKQYLGCQLRASGYTRYFVLTVPRSFPAMFRYTKCVGGGKCFAIAIPDWIIKDNIDNHVDDDLSYQNDNEVDKFRQHLACME